MLAAFGVAGTAPDPLPGGQGESWLCQDLVLKKAASAAEAAWIASTFEVLQATDIRFARPVRSMDGRWVIGGYTAHRYVAGRAEARYQEILDAGDSLHLALAGLQRPRFLLDREDLYSWADRLAFGETDDMGPLGDGHGAALYQRMRDGLRPVDLPSQVVHGDLFGNVLFAPGLPPAIIDITPYWRPVSWAAAVVVVDALAWGGAGTELVEQQSDRPQWPQMLRRALLFRLGVALAHPRSTAEALVELMSAAEVVSDQLDD